MTITKNFLLDHIVFTAKIIRCAVAEQNLHRRLIAKMKKEAPMIRASRWDDEHVQLNDVEILADRLSDCLEGLMSAYLEVYGTREFVKPIADTGILTEDQINEICDDILENKITHSI